MLQIARLTQLVEVSIALRYERYTSLTLPIQFATFTTALEIALSRVRAPYRAFCCVRLCLPPPRIITFTSLPPERVSQLSDAFPLFLPDPSYKMAIRKTHVRSDKRKKREHEQAAIKEAARKKSKKPILGRKQKTTVETSFRASRLHLTAMHCCLHVAPSSKASRSGTRTFRSISRACWTMPQSAMDATMCRRSPKRLLLTMRRKIWCVATELAKTRD